MIVGRRYLLKNPFRVECTVKGVGTGYRSLSKGDTVEIVGEMNASKYFIRVFVSGLYEDPYVFKMSKKNLEDNCVVDVAGTMKNIYLEKRKSSEK